MFMHIDVFDLAINAPRYLKVVPAYTSQRKIVFIIIRC